MTRATTRGSFLLPEAGLSDLAVEKKQHGVVPTPGGQWNCLSLSVKQPGTDAVVMRELVFSAASGVHDYMRTRVRPEVELTPASLAELARVADFRELIEADTTYRFTLVVDTEGVGLQVLRGDGVVTIFRNASPCLGDYTRDELLGIADCA